MRYPREKLLACRWPSVGAGKHDTGQMSGNARMLGNDLVSNAKRVMACQGEARDVTVWPETYSGVIGATRPVCSENQENPRPIAQNHTRGPAEPLRMGAPPRPAQQPNRDRADEGAGGGTARPPAPRTAELISIWAAPVFR